MISIKGLFTEVAYPTPKVEVSLPKGAEHVFYCIEKAVGEKIPTRSYSGVPNHISIHAMLDGVLIDVDQGILNIEKKKEVYVVDLPQKVSSGKHTLQIKVGVRVSDNEVAFIYQSPEFIIEYDPATPAKSA